jgi:four helix bundle protein
MQIVEDTYAAVKTMPPSERYGLIRQMCRASTSIASNIAEGFARGRRKQFAAFLGIAAGSAAELQCQAEAAHRVGLLDIGLAAALTTKCAAIREAIEITREALEGPGGPPEPITPQNN